MTTNRSLKGTGRVEWVDMAKGIAILLVIVAHTDYSILRHFIFSFHMPLFFILSGYTFRCSVSPEEFLKKAKKAFQHLVVPGVSLVLVLRVLNYMLNGYDGSLGQYAGQSLISLLFYSGVDATFLGHTIEGVGVAWFFVAFFLSRTLYDYLHLKLRKESRIVVVTILTIIGVLVSKWLWLPLSFDIALSALLFVETGHLLAQIRVFEDLSVMRQSFNTICWLGGGNNHTLFSTQLFGACSKALSHFSTMLCCGHHRNIGCV